VLSIPELDGVQWIPGDGKPTCAHWPEVYRKIAAAGKKIQIINGGLRRRGRCHRADWRRQGRTVSRRERAD
jgi:hypothetical protein